MAIPGELASSHLIGVSSEISVIRGIYKRHFIQHVRKFVTTVEHNSACVRTVIPKSLFQGSFDC